MRQQPHTLFTAPQHLAASVRSPQVTVSLDNEGHCKKIRLAARWQDVYSIVGQEAALSPATTAFALHRLGCLFVYMSWQRRAGEYPTPMLSHSHSTVSMHSPSMQTSQQMSVRWGVVALLKLGQCLPKCLCQANLGCWPSDEAKWGLCLDIINLRLAASYLCLQSWRGPSWWIIWLKRLPSMSKALVPQRSRLLWTASHASDASRPLFARCSCAAGDCLMIALEIVDGVAIEHGFQ